MSKLRASLPRLVGSLAIVAACAALTAGCERKPTAAEIAAEIEDARRAQAPPATPAPTPQPGSWMFEKNRKNPLEQPARK